VTPRQKRLTIIVGILAAVGGRHRARAQRVQFQPRLLLLAVAGRRARGARRGRAFRVGGMVTTGSVKRDGVDVVFTVTDLVKSMQVHYRGPLPDLFKEGKGVVAQGKLGPDGVFTAQEVLAKHDENYMPPEAAAALKKAAEHGGSMKTDEPLKAQR
jgi:cytochrome c-type biogenesis protein CcmE